MYILLIIGIIIGGYKTYNHLDYQITKLKKTNVILTNYLVATMDALSDNNDIFKKFLKDLTEEFYKAYGN